MIHSSKGQKGFTLVETLVGAAVFLIISLSVYLTYAKTIDVVRIARLKTVAAALANEQFEIMRNLSFEDVGVVGGLPSGKIPRTQTLTRDGKQFTVISTIRNIDDPFDGTIGGTPNDLSPADYRLAEVEISCALCRNFQPIRFTTWIAPRALETASANGALFVRAFDAGGQPVSGANVHIENNQAFPPFSIDDTTNNEGVLQVVDAPPGAEAYEIGVSKSGYSSDMTYQSGAVGNPNPAKPHATVATQELTQISFSIDQTSIIDVSSVLDTCDAIPSIDFSLQGSKLIGTNPNILKYNAVHVTDDSGIKTISDLEWDTYILSFIDAGYDLAGTIPLSPLVLNPNSNQDFKLIVSPKDPRSIMVTVRDASTQLPLSEVSVELWKEGYDNTLITGRGFMRQTDWSGGSGQADFEDFAKYFASDGNVETGDPNGEIQLNKVFDEYVSSGYLISSTFDTGSASNFYQILWQPQDQPPETGVDSIRLQIATNNDNATWNFTGFDGTADTYYTISNQNVNKVNNGNRYLRYKVYLGTSDPLWTPVVSDVSFTFTSSCVPPGQVLFSGLDTGSYTLTASKSGYQTFSEAEVISSSWQQREITLSP